MRPRPSSSGNNVVETYWPCQITQSSSSGNSVKQSIGTNRDKEDGVGVAHRHSVRQTDDGLIVERSDATAPQTQLCYLLLA